MLPTKSLQMSIEELKEWLSSDNPDFTPPLGHKGFKNVNLMMASVMLIKTLNERPRRMRQELTDVIYDVRETVEQNKKEDLEKVLKAFLAELTNENVKTCPVPLPIVKVILYAMADNNMIKPPKGQDVFDKILNTRAVLYTLSKKMSKEIEKEATEKATPPDQSPENPVKLEQGEKPSTPEPDPEKQA